MAKRSLIAAFASIVLLSSGGARADAIDGEWCANTDGRHMSIKGPDIVTPAGTRMQGNYTRHSFLYVVPSAEPDAGQTVAMILVNEETVNLRQADFLRLAIGVQQIAVEAVGGLLRWRRRHGLRDGRRGEGEADEQEGDQHGDDR